MCWVSFCLSFSIFLMHEWGVSEMPVIDSLSAFKPMLKRDIEINRHSWDLVVLHRIAVVLVLLAQLCNKTEYHLDAVCWKPWHMHACSSVSLLVYKEYHCPLVSIHFWLLCSSTNCSALRKSAVMDTVIKACNTIRNFLYLHMVAIRVLSISNFNGYSFSDCQKVTNSLLLCSLACLR